MREYSPALAKAADCCLLLIFHDMQSRCSGWLSVFDDQALALNATRSSTDHELAVLSAAAWGQRKIVRRYTARVKWINSVVNDIAPPVGDVSVRKVTNEVD